MTWSVLSSYNTVFATKGLCMFKRMVLALLMASVLVACDGKPDESPKYQPVMNLNPQHFVTATGKIDPSLGIQVTWYSEFNTSKEACEVWPYGEVNEGGVKAAREKIMSFTVIPDKNGLYSIKIPIEQLESGFCDWQISAVYYAFSYQNQLRGADANTAMAFDKPSDKISKHLKQTWMCNNTKCVLSKQSRITFPDNLSVKNNISVELNFERG
jgi:hypothetical protein